MIHNTILNKYSLLKHNTFGLDIKTEYFFSYDSELNLIQKLPEINKIGCPIFTIGEGSNLLFLKDYEGIIIYSTIKTCEVTEYNETNVIVRAGSGMIWDDLVQWAVDNNYGGIENLTAIPGTVGASPVQNVGAYGVEAKDIIHEVETIEIATGAKRIFTNSDCQFAYRDSIFKNELKGKYIVTYVSYKLDKTPTFKLSYGNINAMLEGQTPNLSLIRKVIKEVRESKLPDHKIMGNAGSFFTNPYIKKSQYNELIKTFPDMPHYPVNDTEVKVPAGWLIDQAGFKGFRHKGAAVHKDQALVLINTGETTGEAIIELSDIIIKTIYDKYGITLVPEVNKIG